VVFASFLLRGFGVPAHPFLRGLLHFYGISLCALNPNSILHIAIFINLCEAYLGIEPHFNLFRYLFVLKPHPTTERPHVVGGAGFQLREGRGQEYFDIPFPTTNKGWQSEWLYIGNHSPALSTEIDSRPVPSESWSSLPKDSEMDQVRELLGFIAEQKSVGLTAVGVAANFVLRRIQPLKQRAHPAFEYYAEGDNTREAPERVDKNQAASRVAKFFASGTSLRTSDGPKAYNLSNPRPEVIN